MAFLIIPEIKEMINKLSLYAKSAKNNIQRRYYESALKDLQKTLEILEEENRKKGE